MSLMFAEVAIVCLAGALGGVGLLAVLKSPLEEMLRVHLQRPAFIDVNVRLVFAAALAALSAMIAVSAIPWLRVASQHQHRALRAGSVAAGAYAGAVTARRLVIAQLAAALTLSVLTVAVGSAYLRSQQVTVDFESTEVSIARPYPRSISGGDSVTFRESDPLLTQLHETPGLISAVAAPPRIRIARAAGGQTSGAFGIAVQPVSAGFMEVLGVRALKGRSMRQEDERNGNIAIANRALAMSLGGLDEALGKGIWIRRPPAPESLFTIVGIVDMASPLERNMVALSLSRRQKNDPTMFAATHRFSAGEGLMLLTRGTNTWQRARALDNAVARDPQGWQAEPAEELRQFLAEPFAELRLKTAVMGAFAALSIALAALGMYVLMADSVNRRAAEFGVRMALGATPRRVWWEILGEALLLLLCGVLIGAIVSIWLLWTFRDAITRAPIRQMLSATYNARISDPLLFASALALIGAMVVVAASLSAWRFTQCEPSEALRMGSI